MTQSREKLLEEHISNGRKLIGTVVSIGQSGTTYFNEEATRDTIRHYAWGVTDMNPLWLDETYAGGTRFGVIIAPPTFLYSVVLPTMARSRLKPPPGTPWTTLYGGTSWDLYRVVAIGDRIHATGRLIDSCIKASKTVGQIGVLTTEIHYWNQNQQLVAKAVAPNIVFPSTEPLAPPVRADDQPAGASELAPELIENNISRRGEEPLYWEEVETGQGLPDLSKGRMRMVDIIRWHAGTYGPPFLPASVTASGELAGASHYEPELAKSSGLPGAYDNGPLRGGWLSEAITNWMGNWGDLIHLEYSLRHMNLVGDINAVRGTVARKYTVDGDGLVDLELWIENQRDERTANAKATVRLPQEGI